MIVGTLLADAGEIFWQGKPSHLQKRQIGIVEDGGFYDRLTVRQNLEFFASLYGLRSWRLDPFTLDFLDLPYEQCSLGMKQKVRITRALLHEPELLLLDEPENGLDQKSRRLFRAWLEDWLKGRYALVVQHDHSFGKKIQIIEGRFQCSF